MSEPVRLPPGPRGWPAVGSLPTIIDDPLAFYSAMTLDFGPVSYARVGPARVYMVNEPALIDELLIKHHKSCIKDAITRTLHPLVGQGLLTSEGEFWKGQRKLAGPPLAPRRITAYAEPMVDAAARSFESFAEGETRDFNADIMRLTLEVVGKTLLGVSTAEESAGVAQVVDTSLAYFEERLNSWLRLLPQSFPTPKLLRFRKAKRELDAIVGKIIARCRQEDSAADHLLARLVRARTEDGQAMSEQQLLDEAVTMLLAGHETTALTLTYAVYLLSKNPAAAARLQAEIDTLGGRPVTAADLGALPYLDAVVRESMRLYPPAYVFGREVVEAFELGGYTFPVGAQVLVSPFAMHRNPRTFPEPTAFQPERWLEGSARALPRMAYLPFGGGPRICIGSHFAQLEAGLLLATLTQHVELHVLPSFELELAPAITLRSREGLPVRVRRRRRAAMRLAEAAPSVGLLEAAQAAGCPHAAAALSKSHAS